ncbi:MAG: SpoIID/LytB domain-containing protein [Lachnospiraceae bacterium]|nr:SpoIID/LytB domain-containing protein [Lachnospiraceae bacterium]
MRDKNRNNGYTLIIIMAVVFLGLMYCWWQGEKEDFETEEEQPPVEEIYRNVWISDAAEGRIRVCKEGRAYEFAIHDSVNIAEKFADITVTEDVVTHIALKEEEISGKIIAINEDSIVIEGYGNVALAKDVAVIEKDNELKFLTMKDVIVGCDSARIVVGDGCVCGIIIEEQYDVQNIRVLIMTDNYYDLYHDEVAVTAATGYEVKIGNAVEYYGVYEKKTISAEDFGDEDRIYIAAKDEGKIELASLKRSGGAPSYRGIIELVLTDKGILVINELGLEEYLYAVLPSEMPANYGVEAMKAQAVCARSYAYKQILDNKLGYLGAHVNDSSQYQVYNNMGENKVAIEAVNATKGQILVHEDEIVEAYYFSTSCGHTTDADIWGNSLGYIKGKLTDGSNLQMLLDTEEKFAEFIKNKDFKSYDMVHEWYRWEVDFTFDRLTDNIRSAGLYKNVGEVKEIEIIERKTGGIVNKIRVTGNSGSIIVEDQNTIRRLLNPNGLDIVRMDKTIVDNFTLLPSAYFTLEPLYQEGAVCGYRLYGGGFGHGVGMSQKGAKTMTDIGMKYDEILRYYYDEITIRNCYSDIGK